MRSLLDRIVAGVVAAIRKDAPAIRHVYPYVWPREMATVDGPIAIVSAPSESFDDDTNEAIEVALTVDVNVVVAREDVEADLDRSTVEVHKALFGSRDGKLAGLDWTDRLALAGRQVTQLEEDDTVVVQTLKLRVSYTQHAYDITEIWPGGIEL